MKAGSKRRRTQAEMKEQYEMEQLEAIEKMEREAITQCKNEEIARLEAKLQEMQENLV